MASMFEPTSTTTKEFTFQFLEQITNNFSKEHIIGHGGYGVVYKGVLENGENIALKKLHYMPGLDNVQFMNEFNNLMRVQHPNIIRLVGYCYNLGHERFKYNGEYIFAHVEKRVLCFEYLQGGSLDKHISDESCGLDWHTRFKIIKGVSEGLNYLHNGTKDPIYHLDLKPANILLDKNMVPKIGDFGLSRLFPSALTYVATKIMGTIGYMPPEYIERCQITSKFDIFSLGVIVMRIVAGDEGYSKFEHMSSQEFLEHVHENWRKRLQATMSSHTSIQIKTCIEIALRCVEVDRVKRPTITEIVGELNKIDFAESSALGQKMEDSKEIMKKQVDNRYARKDCISSLVKYHTQPVHISMGAMSSLLWKLLGLIQYNYLHADMKEQLESLYKEMVGIQAALHRVTKMPQHQLDGAVKLWAKQVRDLSYGAENIVDLVLPHTKQEATEGTIPDLVRQVKARHEIRVAINCIMEKVHNVATRPEQCLSDLNKDHEEMVGIKVTRDEVIRKLRTRYDIDGVPIKQLYMVSIVGMAGLGKTTLAKAVYDKVQEQFDCRAFVTVSRHPNMKYIFLEILIQIDREKFMDINAATLDESLLINELQRLLANKRYFIVIDNISDERSLEIIKFVLLDSKNGSRVVITTRNFKVAQKAGDVYMLKEVSHRHLEELFNARLFGGRRKLSTFLTEISEALLQRCGGVPLAIIAMASLLAEKPRDDWSKLYNPIEFLSAGSNSIDFGHGGSEENTREVLLLSYNDVPEYLKTCLLHLNMFSEGYPILKETLIWMWVAEGFVREEPGIGLFQLGERYFNDLINRSLIIPVEDSCRCKVIGCHVHDLVLDLINSLSNKENVVTILDGIEQHNPTQGIAHRLAIHNMAAEQNNNLADKRTKQVRSFNTTRCHFSVMLSLSMFELLRVLSIEKCTFMKGRPCDLKQLGKLLQLRYLGLYNTAIRELPEEVGALYYLQTLDLRGTRVIELPYSVSQLSQLKCLRLDDFRQVPDWIGSLISLEELRLDKVSMSFNSVKGLGKLKELRELQVWIKDFAVSSTACNVHSRFNKALVESLCNLNKTEVLRLTTGGSPGDYNWESYVPPRQLRELRLAMTLLRLPAWINASSVPNLSHLSLDLKAVGKQDMDIIGYLPELVGLELLKPSGVFLAIKGGHLFPKLVSFVTSAPFRFLSGAMPALEFLHFKTDVQALKCARFDFDSGFDTLENLLLLETVEVEISSSGADAKVQANVGEEAVKRTLDEHPNKPTYDFRRTVT